MEQIIKKLYVKTNKMNFKVSVSVISAFFILYYHYIYSENKRFFMSLLEEIFNLLDKLMLYSYAFCFVGFLALIVVVFYKNNFAKTFMVLLYLFGSFTSLKMLLERFPQCKIFIFSIHIANVLFFVISLILLYDKVRQIKETYR